MMQRDCRLIASPTHTVLFLVIIAALGIAGIVFQNGAPGSAVPAAHTSVIPLYLSVILAEWALVRFVWTGIRSKGLKLRDLIGGSWASANRVVTDVLLAAGVWLIFRFAIYIPAAHIMGAPAAHAHPANPLLIHSIDPVAAILWVLVSASAGFCEEVVFRGYLQRQFKALTGNGMAAVLLQAVVFAFAHAYEGAHAVVVIGLFALLLGLLARWRGSLRPGMIAHAWADIFDNLLAQAS